MKRERASGRDAAEVARLKLDGRPLSKEQAKKAADLAAAWQEHDDFWNITHGEFVPDPPGADAAARAARLAELEEERGEEHVHTDSLPPPREDPE